MYSDRTGMDKNHPRQNLPDKRPPDKTTPDKTFQTKDPLTKPPGQKLPQTIETEFAQGALVRVFCTRPSKKRGGGSEMCDILSGVPGCVTGGGGVKIGQK